MLDDLKYIHQRDGQDALGVASKQWQQFLYKFDCPKINGPISNIVYAGMGGSALAAQISAKWPGHKAPFIVCRNRHLPSFVSKKTLVIVSSYSGNTEETLSAFSEAQKAQAKIIAITSGGKLQLLTKNKYPCIIIPGGLQPRFAVLYNLKALSSIIYAAKLTDQKNLDRQFQKTASFISNAVQDWQATVPASKNPAKKLAMEIAGTSPVIYSGPSMSPIAYKWKINFNENAKNVAWWNEFPEFNHNEFIGWSSHPPQKPYSVILLRSKYEDRQINKRFKLSNRLLSGRWPSPHFIDAKGSSLLDQLVWTMVFGDFVSIYLAFINNVNPTPVDLVEKFKEQLNQ